VKPITAFVSAVILLALPLSAVSAGGKALYEVDGRTYEGYFTQPHDRAPLVLLIHDWDGLTDYEITRADMLAELGYSVFAADMYGAGVRPASIEERRRLTGELYKDRPKMRNLLEAALRAAASNGADVGNAIAMGYCFGGTAVLELARSGADLKGFVAFHGGLSTPEDQDYSRTRGQVLIFHGSADESVSMAEFADLAGSLEKAGVTHEMTTYGGAPHAFTVFGSERYREDADRRSWRRFTQFLADVLTVPVEPEEDASE